MNVFQIDRFQISKTCQTLKHSSRTLICLKIEWGGNAKFKPKFRPSIVRITRVHVHWADVRQMWRSILLPVLPPTMLSMSIRILSNRKKTYHDWVVARWSILSQRKIWYLSKLVLIYYKISIIKNVKKWRYIPQSRWWREINNTERSTKNMCQKWCQISMILKERYK